VLSSTGSQEWADRVTVRQGCGRSVQTSDKVHAGVRSFTLIQFCVGHISSPFSEKSSYLLTSTIQIPLMHLQVTTSTILQTTIRMKLSFDSTIMIVVITSSNLIINWADVLGLGDRSGELEIRKYEASPSETGLEYWRNYYKKIHLALVSLVSPALSSTSSCSSSMLFY
jgi:hypothetical protein